jgi:hypothetical protein
VTVFDFCSDGPPLRAGVLSRSAPALDAPAIQHSVEIGRKGLPREPENLDSAIVNEAFRRHQHLDFEPE